MTYLLDTCVISDVVKGESNTLKRFKQTSPADISISAITLMEIQYGFALNPARAAKLQPLIAGILEVITVLDFGVSEAEYAAEIRKDLKTAGTPIGAYDILIAATARTHNLTAVTANIREFERIEELKIENWRVQ